MTGLGVIIGGGEIGQAVANLCQPSKLVGIWDNEPSRSTLASPTDLSQADVVFISVPSQFIRQALMENTPHLKPSATIVALTKGLEEESNKLIPEILVELLPTHNWALLSGPMIAEEILAGKPTQAVIATEQVATNELIKTILDETKIVTRYTSEVKAVALLAALKNIYAIGSGILSSLNMGQNIQATFITKALAEMVAILKIEQAASPLVYDLPGLGDLLATSLSADSLNCQVGQALVRGEIPIISEGVHAIRCLNTRLAGQLTNFPLFTTLYDIIENKAKPNLLIRAIYG
ncbi:MAG: hypothetical protein HYV76_02380 [Candidatus Vogelbacteria bacterium]|nr:hypothetical protein [Candidatus Vogelbacteria bacterium]